MLNFPKNKAAEIPKRFSELWALWPRQTGVDSACQDYLSVVTMENEAEVFACAGRYLESDEVKRGAVKNLGSTLKSTGWLIDCARDNWACNWPKARDPAAKIDPALALIRKRKEQEEQRHDNRY